MTYALLTVPRRCSWSAMSAGGGNRPILRRVGIFTSAFVTKLSRMTRRRTLEPILRPNKCSDPIRELLPKLRARARKYAFALV